MVITILLSYLMDLEQYGVGLVGDVPPGLPPLVNPFERFGSDFASLLVRCCLCVVYVICFGRYPNGGTATLHHR